jgi:CRP/FNR family transcriptional regulator, nitrogen oxide reductase regulator
VPEATAEILRSSALFRRLSPEDRARVAAVARVATYGRGAVIFAEDEPSNDFFVVVSGRVKVYKMTPAGKDVILEIFGAGDPLGAVAVYERSPFPASAMALEPVTCVVIAREAFFELLERYPSLVRGLLLGLTHRLVELTARIAELTGGRVEPRFARLFLKMAADVGRQQSGCTFVPMPLSRQELADMTGTTIETAIRIMSRWSKHDIVRTEKDGFTIVNREELATLALT